MAYFKLPPRHSLRITEENLNKDIQYPIRYSNRLSLEYKSGVLPLF
jgi:hypothetical protein